MRDLKSSNLINILKKYPLHIILLAIFFLLHSSNYYAGLLPGKDIFLAFVYTLGALAVTYALFYLICRNITNAGIATTIFGIIFEPGFTGNHFISEYCLVGVGLSNRIIEVWEMGHHQVSINKTG